MRYEVKAVLAGRGTVFLQLDAPSEEDARLQVAAQGGTVLAVRRKLSGWIPKQKVRFPLAHFSHELLSLLVAGLSLVEAIETLADKETDAGTRQIIQGLLGRLYEGVTLSRALESFPQATAKTTLCWFLFRSRKNSLVIPANFGSFL